MRIPLILSIEDDVGECKSRSLGSCGGKWRDSCTDALGGPGLETVTRVPRSTPKFVSFPYFLPRIARRRYGSACLRADQSCALLSSEMSERCFIRHFRSVRDRPPCPGHTGCLCSFSATLRVSICTNIRAPLLLRCFKPSIYVGHTCSTALGRFVLREMR